MREPNGNFRTEKDSNSNSGKSGWMGSIVEWQSLIDGRIIGLENKIVEFTSLNRKRTRKNDLWDKRYSIYVIEVPEKEERGNGLNNTWSDHDRTSPRRWKTSWNKFKKCWSSSIISRNKVVSEQMKIKLQKTNSKKNNIIKNKNNFSKKQQL